MSIERDPFDLLKGYDPVDTGALPDADSLVGRAMFERVTSAPIQVAAHRRRRIIVVVVAMLAVAAGVAMTWYVLTREVDQLNVTCYADVNLDADRVGIVVDGYPTSDACEEFWAEGPLAHPDIAPGVVPPLMVCVTDTGAFVVFPTDDRGICEQLGQSSPNPSQSPSELDSASAALDEIREFILTSSCQPVADAELKIREILHAHGLDDWTVTRQPHDSGSPCASVAFTTELKTVVIVPTPDLSSGQG